MAVSRPRSLATLREVFARTAAQSGLPDLDAAAVKLAEPRTLTQQIARWVYETPADQVEAAADQAPAAGVRFDSRHGDGVALWAVFEQPTDPAVSPRITQPADQPLTDTTPELLDAFTTHHLRWAV